MITTVEAKIQNWVITPLEKIKANPKKVLIYLEYETKDKSNKKKIDLSKITWIIKKDFEWEYKKELFNKYN